MHFNHEGRLLRLFPKNAFISFAGNGIGAFCELIAPTGGGTPTTAYFGIRELLSGEQRAVVVSVVTHIPTGIRPDRTAGNLIGGAQYRDGALTLRIFMMPKKNYS